MGVICYFLVTVTCFIGNIYAQDTAYMTALTVNNVKNLTKENPVIMILFTVDWCTKCHIAWSEYKLLAREVNQSGLPVVMTYVNQTTDEILADEFQVKEFPTVVLMNYGENLYYHGVYSTQALLNFLKSEIDSPVKLCSSVEEIEIHREKDDAVLLGLFHSTKHYNFLKFKLTAKKAYKYIKPMISTTKTVLQHFNSDQTNYSILILKSTRFSSSRLTDNIVNVTNLYENVSLNAKQIVNEIMHKQVSPIGLYNHHTSALYNSIENITLCMITFPISLQQRNYKAINTLAEDLRKMSEESFKQKIHWVIVDDTENSNFVESFQDEQEQSEELIAGCKINGQKYQLYRMKRDMDELKLFVAKSLLKAYTSLS
uniref:Thioredoxin domain-containing protein n=1 Tax=Trichobilharzia regenti TaxID=157069 RepID=A0AA85JTI1_TRIRE|nr:unnamed protein product [Trichobilharzia regenti]